VFIGVFHLYGAGYFFSYITIVVNLDDIAHEKKIKELFLVFVFTAHTNIYIYIYIFICFWLLCLLVFLIYIVLVFFFFFFFPLYNHCC
jgi:hypothetical protein